MLLTMTDNELLRILLMDSGFLITNESLVFTNLVTAVIVMVS